MTPGTGILLFDEPERSSCGWSVLDGRVERFATMPTGRWTAWLTNLPLGACDVGASDPTLLPADYLGFDFEDVLRVWGRNAEETNATYVVELASKQMRRIDMVVAGISSAGGDMRLEGPSLSHDVARAMDPDVDPAGIPSSVVRPSNRRMEEAVDGATVLRCPRLAYARMTVGKAAGAPPRSHCVEPGLALTALSSMNELSVTHGIVAQAIRRLFDVDPVLGDLDASFGRRLASEANQEGWMAMPGGDGAVLVAGVTDRDPAGIFSASLSRELRPVVSNTEHEDGRAGRLHGVDPIVADIGADMAWEIDRRVCT